MSCCRMCNLDDVFVMIILMWYDYCLLLEKCNFKCLWCDILFIFCLFKYKFGCRVWFCLVLIVMFLVFWGLKVINYWLDYLWILLRLLFNVLFVMIGLLIIMYKVVLFVNNLIEDFMLSIILFIYIRNNNGFNIEFWGILVFMLC